jgi:hypothetical protein
VTAVGLGTGREAWQWLVTRSANLSTMSQRADLQKTIDAAAQRHRRLKPACELSASMHTVRAVLAARAELQPATDKKQRLAVPEAPEKVLPDRAQDS